MRLPKGFRKRHRDPSFVDDIVLVGDGEGI